MTEPTPAETGTETYFQSRCQSIGLSPEKNVLFVQDPADPEKQIALPLMREEPKNKGILVPVYNLKGQPQRYTQINSVKADSKTGKPIEILRHHPDTYTKMCEQADADGKKHPGKYYMPKGAKAYPWISPNIIEAAKTGKSIDTIILTEGYIKAIAAYVHGFFIFGLSSISTYQDKDTGTMHPDILEVIKTCNVKNVVLLYDGDCANISLKALEAGKDLYLRPAGFFSSARNIVELLKDTQRHHYFDIYFAHVNTDEIEGEPKGIDDLFEACKGQESAIVSELTSYSKTKTHYFKRFNITTNLVRVLNHLKINDAQTFHTAHSQIIKEKPFVFHGTKFQYDAEKNELKIVVPGAAKSYFRVGDDYFEKIYVPNEIGKLEYRFDKRTKGTIIDDHGKTIIPHIPKYKAFCVKPDHVNYQEVIDNCFNSYKPFEYEPSGADTDCPTIMSFLEHIFRDMLPLGLDYIQLLYQRPTEKLPILCLVSREQKTGKSTFTDFLKAIFTGNMAIIGNDQLENNFNAGWADKLIICCEESFIEKKKTVEKIKALSTGKRIDMERKGVDSTEISFFGKFILNSNNETTFTIANETDTRYWVIKVHAVEASNPNLLDELIAEIPNFLQLLNSRSLSVPTKEDRMWFAFDKIRTSAFDKLVEANKSGPQRELTNIVKNLFLDAGVWKLQFTLKYICETLLRGRFEKNYIEKILHEKFAIRTGTPATFAVPEIKQINEGDVLTEKTIAIRLQGRPYTFYANQYLTEDQLQGFELSPWARAYGQEDECPEQYKNTSGQLVQYTDDIPF